MQISLDQQIKNLETQFKGELDLELYLKNCLQTIYVAAGPSPMGAFLPLRSGDWGTAGYCQGPKEEIPDLEDLLDGTSDFVDKMINGGEFQVVPPNSVWYDVNQVPAFECGWMKQFHVGLFKCLTVDRSNVMGVLMRFTKHYPNRHEMAVGIHVSNLLGRSLERMTRIHNRIGKSPFQMPHNGNDEGQGQT